MNRTCTVHCLVSNAEELQALTERIAEAGIAGGCVHVVWRALAGAGAEKPLRAAAQGAWELMLTPTAWWWGFMSAAWGPGKAARKTDPSSRPSPVLLFGSGGRPPRRQHETGPA
jgi:hypothetical protein